MTHIRAFEPNDDPYSTGRREAVQARSDHPPRTASWSHDRDALTKWAVGVITAAMIGLGGWLWAGFNSHETRLVAVETEQKIDKAARTEEQRRLDARLDRMDRKLDEVLMWQRRDLHSPDPTPSSR